MYNRILEGLYREFKTERRETGTISFLNNHGEIVAALYPSTQVLNIFLSASPEVVWNHWDTAIFVIAKQWTIMDDKYMRKAEAAWLIGICGTPYEYNLEHPMFLDIAEYIEGGDDDKLIGYAPLSEVFPTQNNSEVKFNIFDYEITYCFAPEVYSHIDYLNPALVYPIKGIGERDRIRQAARYLRKKYNWEFNLGFNTCGSAETREFICKTASKTNHTQLSEIRYCQTATS